MGFDSKCNFALPTILLGLLLCPWAWSISSQPLQCLPSYTGFSDLGRGVSPQSHSRAMLRYIATSWLLIRERECLKIPRPLTHNMLYEITLAQGELSWEYIKAVYSHPAYLTCMQSTSCKMLDWMKHRVESKLLGEISITSDMLMIPNLYQIYGRKQIRTKEPLDASERGEWKSWLKTQH